MGVEVSKSAFKAHALEIFRTVEATGEPMIVTDHGRQTLLVRKYSPHRSGTLERLKGSVLRYDDPLAPVATEDWESLA